VLKVMGQAQVEWTIFHPYDPSS